MVTALPCEFNPGGVANCAPEPILVTAPDGSSRTIHIFTYDGDPDAIPWTYARALRYLAWFYRPPEGPVGEGNLFEITDDVADSEPCDGLEHHTDSRLVDRLARAADSLDCQGCNLVEALGSLAAASGVHITADTLNEAGRAASRLRIWSPGEGREVALPLAAGGRHPDGVPRFQAAEMTASEVCTANRISQAVLEWDRRETINAPIVIGGVRHYEMTVPLVPGWVPAEYLDNVPPAEREAAKDMALTPDQVDLYWGDVTTDPWFSKYHAEGSQFDQYRNVARLWVLNEDGKFDPATYNRNVPFDDYQPFDFSTAIHAEAAEASNWTRRARRLGKTITRDAQGNELGVYVQVSFDSGATWHVPPGPVRVRFNPTGIYFDRWNPTTIVPPDTDPEVQNLWYAIIEQAFRVRVTALVESDSRLIVSHAPDPRLTPTLLPVTQVVYRPGAYEFAVRGGTTNVLADTYPTGPDVEHDDTASAALAAAMLAQNRQDGQLLVAPRVPWIERELRIGDRITGIAGRRVDLAGRGGNPPVLTGKRYRLDGKRIETELIVARTEWQV